MQSDPLGGWGEFLLALVAFLGTHVIPSRPGIRARLVAIAGRRGYLIAYSAISLLLLYWLIVAGARAPFIELWTFEEWQRLVPQAGMLIASVLLVLGLASPNPLSLGAGGAGFDPERPGIVGVLRHPVLWAAFIWSVSHLVPNGDVAHIILFGLFAAFSVAGMLLLDRRARRRLGEAEWRQLSRRRPGLGGFRPADVAKLAAGVGLYLGLLLGHPYFAGVPALSP